MVLSAAGCPWEWLRGSMSGLSSLTIFAVYRLCDFMAGSLGLGLDLGVVELDSLPVGRRCRVRVKEKIDVMIRLFYVQSASA